MAEMNYSRPRRVHHRQISGRIGHGDFLKEACAAAYSSFEGADPAPLVRIDEGLYILELFHGPTCAFKDMALTLLPHLLKKSCSLTGVKEDVLILTATSGDTGKAALEGFKDVAGTKVAVFYPDEGVSKMQRLQMCTQDGDNVFVAGVRGNFDDCQRAVKKMFASESFNAELKEKGVRLSSANSINFGRLVPQIAYYFSAYLDLVSSDQIEAGAAVDFAVPTAISGTFWRAGTPKKWVCPCESWSVRPIATASSRNFSPRVSTTRNDRFTAPCRRLWTFSCPPISNGSSLKSAGETPL